MSRTANIHRTVKQTFALREEVVARMKLELFSPTLQRIPLGAQGELVSRLLEEYFKRVDELRRVEKQEVARAES